MLLLSGHLGVQGFQRYFLLVYYVRYEPEEES